MKINARIALVCIVMTQLIFIQYGRGQQFSMRGSVVDSITAQPLAHASVYLANSSIGTTTRADGSFLLTGIPTGTYQLIVSTIGYNTVLKKVHIVKDETIAIFLSANVSHLGEVVIVSPRGIKKSVLKKWMDIFFRSVVGTSAFSRSCVIKNAGDIKFQYSSRHNVLTARSNNPLLIENAALGYTIHYHLTSFRYDDSLDIVSYSGYPYYEPLAGTARQEQYWRSNRKAAYGISLLRFMRSVYSRSLSDDGYALFWLNSITNTKAIENPSSAQRNVSTKGVLFAGVDSTIALTADSISQGFDSTSFALKFKNVVLMTQIAGKQTDKKLLVEYAGEKWDEAIQGNGRAGRSTGVYANDLSARNRVSSVLFLQPGTDVLVYANGYYSNGTALNLMGLFAWLEKLGTMLPLDYYPEN